MPARSLKISVTYSENFFLMLLGCTYIASNFRANIWVNVSRAIQSYQIFENKALSIAVKFTQSICFDLEFQIKEFRTSAKIQNNIDASKWHKKKFLRIG